MTCPSWILPEGLGLRDVAAAARTGQHITDAIQRMLLLAAATHPSNG